MITTGGKLAIGNALAQSLGASIAVGIGTSTPSASDTQLDFEVYRAPVRVRNYDATTQRLILAATLPESLDVVISEVGIYTNSSDFSGLLTTFDSVMEEWVGGSWDSANTRMGEAGLRVALGTASMTGSQRVALSNVRQSDVLQVAYFGAGGTVELRIKNTDEDYYKFSFTPLAGYNVTSTAISALTKVGSPDLSSASGLQVTHAGAGYVLMDAIRVNSPQDDEGIIVRQKFTTPMRKVVGMPLDIEVPLVINL